MKYGYIYKTTNLINNKFYVGQKKSSTFVPTYYGSGIRLGEALRKYGNHKRVINNPNRHSIIAYNIYTGAMLYFYSTRECAEYLGLDGQHCLHLACNPDKRHKTKTRYSEWQFYIPSETS